ncbi:MAG: TolC family protein [Candidatus Omnitrophota bacterium]
MSNRFFIAMILMFVFPCASNAEEISMTLDEAVTIALRDNRDLLLKAEDLKKAKYAISEARASLYPALTSGAGWSDTRGLYEKDAGVYTAQAGVKQLLYTGGKVVNTIKVSEYEYVSAQAVLDQAKQDTVYMVKASYYTLLLTRELTELHKTMLENTREHSRFIQARYGRGQASASDTLNIKSALSSMQQAHESAKRQTDTAAEVLRNLLYLDPGVTINPIAQFKYEQQELAYDKAFIKAMQSRPEIKQVEAQRQVSAHALEAARAGNRPTITAAWDYYARSAVLSGTAKNRNDYNVAGISISWPVFDGWLTKSKVGQAIVDVRQGQLTQEKLLKDIALDVKTAYVALSDAIEKMKSIEDQVLVCKDTAEIMRKKFSEGIVSSLEVRDAMLAYDIALFNQTQSLYDYLTAKAAFDKATGGII